MDKPDELSESLGTLIDATVKKMAEVGVSHFQVVGFSENGGDVPVNFLCQICIDRIGDKIKVRIQASHTDGQKT